MTIKEVEQYLEVPRATVRFYEKEGLITPERSGNGYRDYSDADVEKLRKIIVFRKLGMSLPDIEDVLDGAKPLSQAVEENIVNLEKQIEELKGALFVCHKLQEEKEEMETFEVEKYWNVIAEEEKKPNIKSNCVALHRQSEKKPIGSHSVRDLKWRCGGNWTSLSISNKTISTHYFIA